MTTMKNIIKVPVEDRFHIWYAQPLQHIKDTIANGNGAIVALMVAIPLYERYLQKELQKDKTKNRPQIISDDLKFGDIEKAKRFWNVFRDGLCHTGSFFEVSDKSRQKSWKLPKIGLDGKYPDLPIFIQDPTTKDEVIIVNPWGLITHILNKYKDNMSLLEDLDSPLLPLQYMIEVPTEQQ